MTKLQQSYVFKFKMAYISWQTFIFLSVLASVVNAGELFRDDFDTPDKDINRTVWTTIEGDAAYFGRTAIRNPNIPPGMTEGLPTTIEVADGLAKLRLDTYNPTDSNDPKISFWGSEMDTRQTWQPSGGLGISFEVNCRSADMPSGIVTSMFGYHLYDNGNRDEIDFEFLSNHYEYNTNPPTPQVLINYFRNEPTNSPGTPELLPVDIEFKEFNTFRLDWYENEVQWYVNNNLLAARSVTIPGPLDLRFNIWVPDSSFGYAFDGDLKPAQGIASNQPYFYEVNWVRVSTVPEPSAIFLFGAGGIAMALSKRKKGRC